MLSERKLNAQARAIKAVVAELLRRVLIEHMPADRTLAAYLRSHREMGSRDRRVISETVYAVFRWWGWLRRLVFEDEVQSARVAPEVFLDQNAAFWPKLLAGAVVLEGLPYDGLLRMWGDGEGLITSKPAPVASPRDLSARADFFRRLLGPPDNKSLALEELAPAWLADEVRCPRQLAELILWLQRRPPLWLRIQSSEPKAVISELEQAGLDVKLHPHLPEAANVGYPRINLYTLPAYREGRVEIQDLASQAVGRVCAPTPGQRWWDACAGGGGKTLVLAQYLCGKGNVVATDIRERKLREARRRARRGGFHNIRTRLWLGRRVPSRPGSFDGVLVDAPCTCSGTWRRNPAARWSLSRENIVKMAEIQTKLLVCAAEGVKPGGVLVYATCSFFFAENEAVVRQFLRLRRDFVLEPFEHPLNGEPTAGMVQIWPWDGDCDAMFVAKCRRQR